MAEPLGPSEVVNAVHLINDVAEFGYFPHSLRRSTHASAAGLVAGRCDETRYRTVTSEVNTTASPHGSCLLPREETAGGGRSRGNNVLFAPTPEENGTISISSYIRAHKFMFWQIKHDCFAAMRQSLRKSGGREPVFKSSNFLVQQTDGKEKMKLAQLKLSPSNSFIALDEMYH